MRKALVWKEDYQGNSIGQIFRIGEASEITNWNHHLKNKMVSVSIPDSLSSFDESQLKAVFPDEIDKKDQFWFKGISIVNEDPEDESYFFQPQEIDNQWNIIIDLSGFKSEAIREEYDLMNQEVYTEMKNVFGTANPESANAYNETYKLMQSSPSLFSSESLVAIVDTVSFSKGDLLDTDTKVSDFASEALDKIDAYAVWRMKRIKEFSDKKTIIENA